jgi:hypothetical protein
VVLFEAKEELHLADQQRSVQPVDNALSSFGATASDYSAPIAHHVMT